MYVTKSQFFWGVMFMVAIFSMTTLDYSSTVEGFIYSFLSLGTGAIFALASSKED